jgi:hypothetical protein
MLHLAGHDLLGNPLDRRHQSLCCQVAALQQGSVHDRWVSDRRQSLAGARRGEHVPLVQRHGQGVQVGTLVTGRADRSGKAATGEGVTGWATDRVERMLVCQQANVRHIQDVTAFDDAAWDTTEVRMALAADAGTMAHTTSSGCSTSESVCPG